MGSNTSFKGHDSVTHNGSLGTAGEVIRVTRDRVTLVDRRTGRRFSLPIEEVSPMDMTQMHTYYADIPVNDCQQEVEKRRIEVQATWIDREAHKCLQRSRSLTG